MPWYIRFYMKNHDKVLIRFAANVKTQEICSLSKMGAISTGVMEILSPLIKRSLHIFSLILSSLPIEQHAEIIHLVGFELIAPQMYELRNRQKMKSAFQTNVKDAIVNQKVILGHEIRLAILDKFVDSYLIFLYRRTPLMKFLFRALH